LAKISANILYHILPVLVIAHVVGKVEGAIHGDEQPGRNVHKLLIAAATDPGVGEAPFVIIGIK
jgi:hypothetical protein